MTANEITEKFNLAMTWVKHEDLTVNDKKFFIFGIYNTLLIDCPINTPEFKELVKCKYQALKLCNNDVRDWDVETGMPVGLSEIIDMGTY